VQEIDDNLGRLWDVMERQGRFRDTLIVFTADHGDFLGDHWLGEKEHFYDTVQRVPFIVFDPDPAADGTRGSIERRFVEAVDVVPSVLDALGLPAQPERIEGRSLLPLTRGTAGSWRDCVFSELDYAFRQARRTLGRGQYECRAWMARTERWKYVYWIGDRPQLFDLEADPDEFFDLGSDRSLEPVRAAMQARLFDWFTRLKRRTTVNPDELEARTATHKEHGVFFGVW
jgi:arylsulfatase A-like enzyme